MRKDVGKRPKQVLGGIGDRGAAIRRAENKYADYTIKCLVLKPFNKFRGIIWPAISKNSTTSSRRSPFSYFDTYDCSV
ncbi:MAG: hypothetical protein IJ752_01630 [Alphaproteobacteria bacterium]|nr:hypothetical protein [Alphaproteobacteria bacterium]